MQAQSVQVRAGDWVLPGSPWPDGASGCDASPPVQWISGKGAAVPNKEEAAPCSDLSGAFGGPEAGHKRLRTETASDAQPSVASAPRQDMACSPAETAPDDSAANVSATTTAAASADPGSRRGASAGLPSSESATGRLARIVRVAEQDVAKGRYCIEEVVLPVPGGNVREIFCAQANAPLATNGSGDVGSTLLPEGKAHSADKTDTAHQEPDGSDVWSLYERIAAEKRVPLGAASHAESDFSLDGLTGDVRRLVARPRALRHAFVRHSHLDQDIVATGVPEAPQAAAAAAARGGTPAKRARAVAHNQACRKADAVSANQDVRHQEVHASHGNVHESASAGLPGDLSDAGVWHDELQHDAPVCHSRASKGLTFEVSARYT